MDSEKVVAAVDEAVDEIIADEAEEAAPVEARSSYNEEEHAIKDITRYSKAQLDSACADAFAAGQGSQAGEVNTSEEGHGWKHLAIGAAEVGGCILAAAAAVVGGCALFDWMSERRTEQQVDTVDNVA